jgi:NAD(P)-dependent dehydrogenase (short-subunit alcohol dehydrogenase family)
VLPSSPSTNQKPNLLLSIYPPALDNTQFGQAHLLINVTGVLHTPEGLFPETALAKVDPKNLLYSYQVNAVGPLLVTKAFAPLLTSTATSSSNK